MQYSPLLSVMMETARAAARPMMRDFGESDHLRYSVKGNNDFVTQTDRKAEEIICKKLTTARPQFYILAEERGFVPSEIKDERQRGWIIDPLDGTRNFIHGFPFFAISIAAKEKDDIIAGVVYAPLAQEMFVAETGQGAYLNDTRIRVSNCSSVRKSLLGYGRINEYRDQLLRIMKQGPHTRQLGATALALAWTAAGRLDGFITGEAALWDVAAASIILREAGAVITQPNGSSVKLEGEKIALTTANSTLHRMLVQ